MERLKERLEVAEVLMRNWLEELQNRSKLKFNFNSNKKEQVAPKIRKRLALSIYSMNFISRLTLSEKSSVSSHSVYYPVSHDRC